MRTTLTIEPEVADRLKQELALGRRSLKQIVNDALRRGLGIEPPARRRKRVSIRPHSSAFLPGTDLGRLNQAVDELEAVEFHRRHRAPR